MVEALMKNRNLPDETADPVHCQRLHPNDMSLENRKQRLFDLKEIGYRVGSGLMVGFPYQTTAILSLRSG